MGLGPSAARNGGVDMTDPESSGSPPARHLAPLETIRAEAFDSSGLLQAFRAIEQRAREIARNRVAPERTEKDGPQ